MNSIDILRKAKDLKGLNDAQLTAIQECCTEKEYNREDRLFKQGETASLMWLLNEGEISLRFDVPCQKPYDSYSLLKENGTETAETTSKDNTVSVITNGMIFGWSCLVQPYVYSLSAYCESDNCKVIQLDRDSLLKVFSKDPKIGYLIISKTLNIVGQRFHELQTEVVKRKSEDLMFEW
jgi:CRP-like cAMP-binding protein